MTLELTKRNKPLNRATIKYILIVLMVLDHIALSIGENSPIYLPFRIVARLVGPTMAYFVAEGYCHTHNVKKYVLRLLVFAIISHIPYALFSGYGAFLFKLVPGNQALPLSLYLPNINKTFVVCETSVFFTLLLGLCAIIIWDKVKLPKLIKALIIIAILWLAMFGDWWYINVLFCLVFYVFRDKKVLKWIAYMLVNMLYIFNIAIAANPFNISIDPKFRTYRIGVVLVIPFIELLYNGNPGKKNFVNKWFFYIFYPLHFIALYFIFK